MLRILQISASPILNSLRLGETTVIREEHRRRTKALVYAVKYFFQVDVCRRKYTETEVIWKKKSTFVVLLCFKNTGSQLKKKPYHSQYLLLNCIFRLNKSLHVSTSLIQAVGPNAQQYTDYYLNSSQIQQTFGVKGISDRPEEQGLLETIFL